MYILYLYVDSADDKLVEKYKEAASRHNLNLVEKSHPDSGFDVYLPSQTDFIANKASFINFRIKMQDGEKCARSFKTQHNLPRFTCIHVQAFQRHVYV